MSKLDNKYDLAKRTSDFSEKLLEFVKILPLTILNKNIISQVLRSGTSIGANYMEADGAESRKDFEHKIAICRKEAKETIYWMILLQKTSAFKQEEIDWLTQESRELSLIFSSILNKTRAAS